LFVKKKKCPFLSFEKRGVTPENFKTPHLPTFDRKTDPSEHFGSGNTNRHHRRCRSLEKQTTFRNSKGSSTKVVYELTQKFHRKLVRFPTQVHQQFSGSKHIKVTTTSLFATRQNHAETLREYLARFSEATIKVSNPNQEMLVSAFHNGLKADHFNESLAQKPTTSMKEIIKREECYIKGEERNTEKRSKDARERDPINKGSRTTNKSGVT
jgi:hypothetical protein